MSERKQKQHCPQKWILQLTTKPAEFLKFLCFDDDWSGENIHVIYFNVSAWRLFFIKRSLILLRFESLISPSVYFLAIHLALTKSDLATTT